MLNTPVEIEISESYRAHLDLRATIVSGDLCNSFIEGVEGAVVSLTAVLSFLLRYGLAVLFWVGIVARNPLGLLTEPDLLRTIAKQKPVSSSSCQVENQAETDVDQE